MEDEEALVAAFMEATGCGQDDAFDRLACCGGHLGTAINTFFSIDAGPSGSRRSRSPPPSVSVSGSPSSEDADARPVPARRRASRWDSDARVGSSAHRRSPSAGSSTRVSRWDSETRVTARSKSSRRRERRRRLQERGSGTPAPDVDRDWQPDGNHNRSHRRRFREDISSDGEEEEEDEETNNSSRLRLRRRRLNPTPTELTSESESESEKQKAAAADENNKSRHRFRVNSVINVSSSSSSDDDEENDMLELDEPSPAPPPGNRSTFEDLFKVPRELAFTGGGFHAAKLQAARRARWLLANVQSLDLPSLHQNRDVWANALVARCVADRFVLWQADAGAGAGEGYDGEEEEASKVLGYYRIPLDWLPVVVVVDPVTGQAMDVLHGSAACELNDFMVLLGPYTETKPTIPVVMPAPKKSTCNNTGPATTSATTAAPASSERAGAAGSRQEQAPATATTAATTKPPAVAPCTAGQQQPEPSSAEEKVCKVRVRLPDGRVVTKEFGSQCAVAVLFEYCRSMLGAGGEAPPLETTKPFRLLRFVGRATEEIGGDQMNATFECLGLHLTTVSVHLG